MKEIAQSQRAYFRTGATLDLKFRKAMLARLSEALGRWEPQIADALKKDLGKSYQEAYMTEFSIVYSEIKNHIKHLDKWSASKRVKTPMKLFKASSKVVKEPLGSVLIIAPWNYPVQLLLNPLVGAISAGCTAMLKPSPYVPEVSSALTLMIRETFAPEYIYIVEGGRDVNQALLDIRWDMIFFTGSPSLGKVVMEKASRFLTPVVLELGGKSPCIVDSSADIEVAARRIAWGKALNGGQTCIAPDYLILHSSIKDKFVQAYSDSIKKLYKGGVKESEHFTRIVNDKAFERVKGYLSEGEILFGGETDRDDRFIHPTLLDNPSPSAAVMNEEIFGPVFPVITFSGTEDEFVRSVMDHILSREKPLALYYFGKKSSGMEIIKKCSSGGACINDVIMHIANEYLPFGGVGNSGMGRYHGRDSFEAFSHTRSVLVSSTFIDLPFRYMPYKMFPVIKKFL